MDRHPISDFSLSGFSFLCRGRERQQVDLGSSVRSLALAATKPSGLPPRRVHDVIES
jgi:hypothetical protein